MEFKHTIAELGADCVVVFLRKFSRVIFAEIVAVETVLQSERMRDRELLPSNYPACAYFVRLNFKFAIFEAKHMRLLCKNPGQESYNGPT